MGALDGKAAIATGFGTGIGRATAELLCTCSLSTWIAGRGHGAPVNIGS